MAQRLRELRLAANVTYTQMSRRAMYSTTSLSMTAATGNATMPPWAKVSAFVTACGVTDPGELARWREDYDQVVAGVGRPAVTSPMPTGTVPVPPPAAVQTRAQFAAGLRALRRHADLSYQQLVDGSRVLKTGGVLAKSTISDLLTGRIRPTEATLRTFLAVCQQRIFVDVDGWLAALRRVHAAGQPTQHPPVNPTAVGEPAVGEPAVGEPAVGEPAVGDGGRVTTPAPRDRRHGPSINTDMVRQLVSRAELTARVSTATPEERRQLVAATYEIVMPVVFDRSTREFERQRGHYQCSLAIQRLEPDCFDRFHDDVEAVIEHLFRHAGEQPILNLEGWVTSRLTAALVDGHRRRRGQRGAIQRPRIPRWLRDELGDDQWLTTLAIQIQTWVGNPSTAGDRPWPLDAWATRREQITGEYTSDPVTVALDVERVLTIMRRRPDWYERNIERPLGRKQPPLPPPQLIDEERPLALIDRHDEQDSHLQEAAALAITAIEARIQQGEHPGTVVTQVITKVFGDQTGAREMDLPPGEGGHDATLALLADPTVVRRVTDTVLAMLDPAGLTRPTFDDLGTARHSTPPHLPSAPSAPHGLTGAGPGILGSGAVPGGAGRPGLGQGLGAAGRPGLGRIGGAVGTPGQRQPQLGRADGDGVGGPVGRPGLRQVSGAAGQPGLGQADGGAGQGVGGVPGRPRVGRGGGRDVPGAAGRPGAGRVGGRSRRVSSGGGSDAGRLGMTEGPSQDDFMGEDVWWVENTSVRGGGDGAMGGGDQARRRPGSA